jgi:putative peptidoglycan lipid II flippase
LFAPQVASLIATGFTREEQALTASLMRIMLVTPIVFGVSGIVMGILQSHQEFTLPALAPVMYNLAIIGGALFLAPLFGVYGLAYGVVAGAVLHLAIQVPYLLKIEMRYARILAWGDAAVREVGRLMLPRTLGLAAVQINFLVNTILASTLPEGRLAALNYAFLLMLLPQGVIAQSIATTIFPTFSAQAAREDWDNLRATFSTALRVTFFLTIPASVGLILLRVPLVELLLQRGAFNADSTAQTAFALAFFALGLFAHSGLEIVTRGFYALHDTATPVKVGIGAMVLNIALSLILLGPLAQGGLALANSVATILEMSVLLFVFRTRMGKSEDARIGVSLARVVIASALMGASVWGVARVLSASSAWLVAGAGVLVGAGVYAGAVFVLRAPELKSVI